VWLTKENRMICDVKRWICLLPERQDLGVKIFALGTCYCFSERKKNAER
jgi:hypothetical protein